MAVYSIDWISNIGIKERIFVSIIIIKWTSTLYKGWMSSEHVSANVSSLLCTQKNTRTKLTIENSSNSPAKHCQTILLL